MKTNLLKPSVAIAFLILCQPLFAQQNITTPRPSLAASVSQTVGISTVTVNYSRPAVKEREVWGGLVPLGWNVQAFGTEHEAPWRAGANENTVLELSHAAKIQDKEIPAGSYGLFFVINEDNTGEVVLSKDFKSWGNYSYDPARDQMRAPIQVRESTFTEFLTYNFVSADKNSTELVLSWEKKQLPIKITFATDDIVMANAADELKGAKAFDWKANSSAANYALQNKVNLAQGLEWANRSVTQNKNFTTLNIQSGLLQEMGKTAEAEKIKKEALALATEAELNTYGYELLGMNRHDKAIEVLKLTTERYPKSANAWDSLGEAYAMKGDTKNAITNFKKALSMNPPENVRANSEKYLKQFGAL